MNYLKVSSLSLLFFSNGFWISDSDAMDFPDETTVCSPGGNSATRMPEVRVPEDFETNFKNAVRSAVLSQNPEALLSLLRSKTEDNIKAREELHNYLSNSRQASVVGLTLNSGHRQEAKDVYRLGLKQNDNWARNHGLQIGREFLSNYEKASSVSARRKLKRKLIGQWSEFISVCWSLNPIALTVHLLWERSCRPLPTLQFLMQPYSMEDLMDSGTPHPELKIELKEHLLASGEPYHAFELVKNAIENADDSKIKRYLEMAKKVYHGDLVHDVRSHPQFGRGKAAHKAALALYLIAADKGCKHSKFWAAEIIERGFEGQLPDLPRAFSLYKELADDGYSLAMHNAGILLGQGFRGQAPDDKRALKYLTRAADKGLSKSMLVLGIYYLSKNNISDAIFWLEKARINRNGIAERYLEIAKQSAFDLKAAAESTHIVEEPSDRQLTQLTIKPVSAPQPSVGETDSEDEEDRSDSSDDEELKTELSIEIHADTAESPHSSKPNFDFRKFSNNPKFIREQLRKLGRKKAKIDQLAEEHREPTAGNSEIIERIKSLDAKLNDRDIKKLFKDPCFKNEVLVSKTKSGMKVKSIKGISAGTHRKHTKDYDGLHRNFLKDLRRVLESFSL